MEDASLPTKGGSDSLASVGAGVNESEGRVMHAVKNPLMIKTISQSPILLKVLLCI